MTDNKAHTCENETGNTFAAIDEVIELYRHTAGNLIQILHASQEIYGYLPLELQRHIANSLAIPLTEVAGVVSFYSFFSTKPRGKHTIRVCMGTACYVRGGQNIVDELNGLLNIQVGDTTADGNFTFEIARCVGACGLAPVMMIDDDVYQVSLGDGHIAKILATY